MDRNDESAKFWLNPVALSRNFGFAPHELNKIEKLVEDPQEDLLEAWYARHGY